jgi:hypothetical protein
MVFAPFFSVQASWIVETPGVNRSISCIQILPLAGKPKVPINDFALRYNMGSGATTERTEGTKSAMTRTYFIAPSPSDGCRCDVALPSREAEDSKDVEKYFKICPLSGYLWAQVRTNDTDLLTLISSEQVQDQ